MKRYFFDVASPSHTHYDYCGREFAQPEKAKELAELIALDLGCSDDNGWVGTEVRVLDIAGLRLFSVPVRESQLIAA
jgi:hypothetical protein